MRQHLEFVRDWWPALATLLFYTYTRGFADSLGISAHEQMPIVADRWLGMGELPTQRLQAWLCADTCADMSAGRWYDTVFTATYLTHFVCGLVLAVVLWLRNREQWARWMRRYLGLNLAGLSIYVIYPMVPPWMASDNGAFQPAIERMTGRGGSGPGLQLSQLVMGPIGNPVAAMPSLHAGTAFLVAFYAITVLRSRLRWALLLYPLVMTTALVYFGEHYVIDALAGAALAALVMLGCRAWERRHSAGPSIVDHPRDLARTS
jgi:membrane-associated phospholipid phosphatase